MNTPKFKKGDWIKGKKDGRIAQVVMLLKTCYSLRLLTGGDSWCLDYDFQDNWELTDVPPKNKLEEAAESIIRGICPISINGEYYFIRKQLFDVFIAGAEWMAGQGITARAPIDELSCGLYNLCVEAGLTSKDDTVIQIRKA